MGRLPYCDARRRGRRLHAPGGHASQLSTGHDYGRCARGEAYSGARQVLGGLGGVGRRGQGQSADIEALAGAGVLGFKCFLIHPGIDGFTMVGEDDLRTALPHLARTGLPLLVHAELAGPMDAATAHLADANWRSYATYLQSRPDEAELSAIRMMLSLCRQYDFHLHIVHLSSGRALPELRAARSEGLKVSVETCPHYLHLAAEDIPDAATLCKCAPPIRSRENREASVASTQGRSHRSGGYRSLSVSAGHEEAGGRELQNRMGWHFEPLGRALRDVDRGQPAGIYADGYRPLDGGGSGATGGMPVPQGSNCPGLRCGPGCFR